jgi:hypothetical protein
MLSGDGIRGKIYSMVIGSTSSGQRDTEAERPDSLEIDDQFYLGTTVPVRVFKTELPLVLPSGMRA